MPAVTLASNYKEAVDTWLPYYYKPFALGRVADGLGSSDGETYITQTAGGSDGTINDGVCFSAHNCGFYYLVEYTGTTYDSFKVDKYTLDGTIVETIYASFNSPHYYDWDIDGANIGYVTIDVGVAIEIVSHSSAEDGDIYRIDLPSREEMERRRIYHGGYATFVRIPTAENTSFNTDIVPTSLMNKNLSISLNPMIAPAGAGGGRHGALQAAVSREDTTGNTAISLSLVWNIDKDGAHSTQATDGVYTWPSGGETWAYGTNTHSDLTMSTVSSTPDFPVHVHSPSNDLVAGTFTTGSIQPLNATLAGRAGYLKFKTEFIQGAGGTPVIANNQFWPLILTIS